MSTAKHRINYIAIKHLDLNEGNMLLDKFRSAYNDIFTSRQQMTEDDDDGVNFASTQAATKKLQIPFLGESVKMNNRLLRMAMKGRLNSCACCSRSIDGFFVGYEMSKSSIEDDLTSPLRLIPTINGQFATCDHIIPRTLGGRDSVSNMQTMCLLCNGSKGHEIEDRDLNLVRDNVLECINPQDLYISSRRITREYKSAQAAVIASRNKAQKAQVKRAIKKRVEIATQSLENLRKLIAFTTSTGISMKPIREAEIARSIANNQLIPA